LRIDGKVKSTIKIESVKKKEEKVIQHYQRDNGIVTPTEITELQGSLQELNNDKVDDITRSSGIDLRTRLVNTEIASIMVLDTLVAFNFLPMSIVPFTLQKKRLAVSLGGKGRDEIVEIVGGKREQDAQSSGKGILSSFFSKKNEGLP